MSTSKKPEIINQELIAQTNVFTIEKLDLRFSNGNEVQYERLMSSRYGAVLIIPMLDNDTVVLIREYAAGVHRYELALPKGKIEKNEDPLNAANREIMEEIGYGANRLTYLRSLSIAPGYLSHETHIVLAEDLYPHRIPGDEPEDIEVVHWKLSELDKLLLNPECTEARSIAGLFIARERLKITKNNL